jgi:hypothetical protein
MLFWRNIMKHIFTCAILFLFTINLFALPDETVTCPATRDVWVSSFSGERDCNMGASDKMKLKIYQEVAIVDFDVSALKGKAIKEAYLYIKPVGQAKLGINGGSDISWLTVSTVTHSWVEGKCAKTYGKDPEGNGATFNESSYKKENWGWPGAKTWDVTLGNGNSLRYEGRLKPHNGRLRIKLNPDLVRALVSNASHGLLLMDGNTNVGVNSFFATRESKEGPFLEVVTGDADTKAPSVPVSVSAVAASLYSTQFVIVDLDPFKNVTLEISAVDAAGNVSKPAVVKTSTSNVLDVPVLPEYGFKPEKGEPAKLGEALVWACPEISKIDPIRGMAIFEPTGKKFRNANPVWSGKKKQIRIFGAKGEIVSFQTVVEGKVKDCTLTLSDLKGPSTIAQKSIRLWRNWYVGRFSEYALPLKGPFSCPSEDNNIQKQNTQAVTVDIHIPPAVKAGTYKGTVSLKTADADVSLPLTLKVYDVTIPDEINFIPELNTYGGGPGRPSGRMACLKRAGCSKSG